LARALYEQSRALAERERDSWGVAAILNNLGILCEEEGDLDAARRLYEESVTIFRELELPGRATSIFNLASVAIRQRRFADARGHYEDVLAIREEEENIRGVAIAWWGLAELARAEGHYEEAVRLIRQALGVWRDLGGGAEWVDALEHFCIALAALGRFELAARLLGAAGALRERLGFARKRGLQQEYEDALEAARCALGEAAFERAHKSGCRLTWEQAIEMALAD
jgi:tetratricopeptide (TPR) repeat protein